MPICYGSAGGWEDIKKMREDIGSYKVNNFAPEYFGNIERLIQMTIQQARQGLPQAGDSFVVDPFQALNPHQLIDFSSTEDSFRLEVALCILWICKNELSDIRIIQGVKNKDNESRLTSLDNLIEVVKNGFNDLVGIEKAKISPENNKDSTDKDSTDLVIYKAFLHTNIKKYNPYYGFDSVVANMLDLYGRTKNPTIRDIIVGELKEIGHDDGNFGPYGDKIKDFPRSLRTILGEK